MKLLRVGPKGHERPAIMDDDGALRDLGGIVPDFVGEGVGLAALDRIRALDPATLPLLSGDPRVGPCLARARILGVGLNYRELAEEAGLAAPAAPAPAPGAPRAPVGPDDPLAIPTGAAQADWAVSLAVVIGRAVENATEAEALAAVAGYCVINDVAGLGVAPLGPWLVTADEVPDPQDLALWLDLNGETMQLSNTRHMIFSAAGIVAALSRRMRLMPGDVIATGTPGGTGMAQTPPIHLRAGDVMELGVAGLGGQRHVCIDGPAPGAQG